MISTRSSKPMTTSDIHDRGYIYTLLNREEVTLATHGWCLPWRQPTDERLFRRHRIDPHDIGALWLGKEGVYRHSENTGDE
jgi:hypothetical protein